MSSKLVNFALGALLSITNWGNCWLWGANESVMGNLLREKGVTVRIQ